VPGKLLGARNGDRQEWQLESIIENPYQKVGELMNQINPEKYPVPENYSNVDFV
jgi:hypothetical protein